MHADFDWKKTEGRKPIGYARANGCFLSRVGHDALELVLIDHRGYSLFSVLFAAADNSPGAVNQDIRNGSNHGRRQHDAETDNRPHRHLTVHMEENATRRDISGFGKMFAGITGADGNGES